jgi:hypothetical protein
MKISALVFGVIALSMSTFGLFAASAYAGDLCDDFPQDCQGANGNGQIGQGGNGK